MTIGTSLEIAEEALRRAPNRISPGGIRALFERSEWDAFERGQRQQAGKIFKSAMSQKDAAAALGANTANHQQYAASAKFDGG
jgi:hypothetical protein